MKTVLMPHHIGGANPCLCAINGPLERSIPTYHKMSIPVADEAIAINDHLCASVRCIFYPSLSLSSDNGLEVDCPKSQV